MILKKNKYTMKHLKEFNIFNEDEWDEIENDPNPEPPLPLEGDERYEVWKIQSYRNIETREIVNNIPDHEIPNSHIPDHWKFEIYQVLRTTDNNIFQIGDNISSNFYNGLEDQYETQFGIVDWIYVMNIQLRFNFGNMGLPFTDDIKVID